MYTPGERVCWTRLWLALSASATFLLLPGLHAQEVDVGEGPIRVDVNLVTLRFTVKDAAGRFVNDLREEHFGVSENGRPEEIAFFLAPREERAVNAPLWLAFLLDVSGSTFATRVEEILAAQSFFENVFDVTQVGIFGFTDKLLVFQDFTSDRKSAVDAFAAARAHLGRTALYESVNTLIAAMDQKAGPRDRKAIIVVSDGMDKEVRKASSSVALARQKNTMLYSVSVPSAAQLYIGPSSTNDESTNEKAQQAAFARLGLETGGKHYGGLEAILDFDNVLAEINDELFGNLYSVGYYTAEPFLERSARRIEIRVNMPGATAHGIFEEMPDRAQAKRRYVEALFDAGSRALLPGREEAFHEIAFDMDILRPRPEGDQTSVPFRLKISSFSLRPERDGRVRTQFGLIGVLTDASGNEVGRLREFFRAQISGGDLKEGRGVIYNNRVIAPPGDYNFRVALIEVPSWRLSVLERRIRVQKQE